MASVRPVPSFVQSPEVLSRELTGEVLLLGDLLDTPLALVGPTADVWPLLAEPRTAAELVEQLAARYHEEPSTVRPAVETTLHSLEENGLIRLVEGEPESVTPR